MLKDLSLYSYSYMQMHMHGAEFDSLHEFIDPENLPTEFAGELEPLDTYSAHHLFEF